MTDPATDAPQDQQPTEGGEGGDSSESPFLQQLGDVFTEFSSGISEAFAGQTEDVVRDVTDPIVKAKKMIEMLNKLVEQAEAEQGQGGESGDGSDGGSDGGSGQDGESGSDSAAA